MVTGELRDACVVLAGLALRAAGGDTDKAKATLPDALQAIGAVPYEPVSRWHWGTAQ